MIQGSSPTSSVTTYASLHVCHCTRLLQKLRCALFVSHAIVAAAAAEADASLTATAAAPCPLAVSLSHGSVA
jgi:hypothetical protein